MPNPAPKLGPVLNGAIPGGSSVTVERLSVSVPRVVQSKPLTGLSAIAA